MGVRATLAARSRLAFAVLPGARRRLRALIEPTEPDSVPVAEVRDERPTPAEETTLPEPAGSHRARVLRLELGTKTDGSPLIWDSSRQANSFVMAIGASGFGKTELLKLYAEAARRASIPVILVDVHDDLKLQRIHEYRIGRDYSLNPLDSTASPTERTAWITAPIREAGSMGHLQTYALTKAVDQTLQEAQAARRRPTLSALKEVISSAKTTSPSSRDGLLGTLEKLFSSSAFSGRELPIANLLSSGGRLQLVDLSPPEQLLVVHTLLSQIWGAVVREGVVPGGRLRALLVLDEAARLKGSALLDRVVREARKFGLGICMASQLPTDMSEVVRGNAGTAVVLGLQEARAQQQAADLLRVASRQQVADLDKPGAAWVRSAEGVTRLQLRRPGGK